MRSICILNTPRDGLQDISIINNTILDFAGVDVRDEQLCKMPISDMWMYKWVISPSYAFHPIYTNLAPLFSQTIEMTQSLRPPNNMFVVSLTFDHFTLIECVSKYSLKGFIELTSLNFVKEVTRHRRCV